MPRHSLSIGFDIVLPIILGTVFVLNIMFMLLVPLVWVILFHMRSNARRDKRLPALPLFGNLVGACTFAAIVYAAASYEPTKTKLQYLGREQTFPLKRIELGELAYLTSSSNVDRQFTINFSFPDAQKLQVVHLPDETVTLQQLLDAVEHDTGMEGRFHSCGNGYSIIQGEDCCFGLNIGGTYFTEEAFDLDAYEEERFKRLNQVIP
ncbi:MULTISPECIES: hypothetical protein [Pirellulaceae]|nr:MULTISPECIES: hypothetical protein [Pirellulaceae]